MVYDRFSFSSSTRNLLVVLALLHFLSLPLAKGQNLDETTFNDVIVRMENIAVSLAREVEKLYETRCDATQMEKCTRASADHCATRLQNQECPGGGLDHPFKTEYHFPQCGPLGGSCSALYDFTRSSVLYFGQQTDENLNFKDPIMTETTCYTVDFDKALVDRKNQDSAFWDGLEVGPRWVLFGTPQGFTRLYPARNSNICERFDPRTRPWYSGGNHGARNIILMLDISESMMQEGRFETAKAAVQRVVSTLNYRDHVAIIPFGSEAYEIADEDGYMMLGSRSNRDFIRGKIDELEVSTGRADIAGAYDKVFDLFFRSVNNGRTANCHSAIFLLTDGISAAADDSARELVGSVVQRTTRLAQEIGHSIAHLTFSVTSAAFDDRIHDFPKEVACQSEIGIWSQLEDASAIIASLSSFYTLFALPLANEPDYVSWAEPYPLVNLNTLSTAVSAPVFARNANPPLFLGVVALPVAFDALNSAFDIYGGYGGSATTIEQFIALETPACPNLNVTPCVLESLQRRASGGRAICANATACSDSDLVQVEVEKCPDETQYPDDLWLNRDNQGIPFEERACCVVGETEPSDQCPPDINSEEDAPWGLIGGIVGAAAFVSVGVAAFLVQKKRKKEEREEEEREQLERARQEREKRRRARSSTTTSTRSCPESKEEGDSHLSTRSCPANLNRGGKATLKQREAEFKARVLM